MEEDIRLKTESIRLKTDKLKVKIQEVIEEQKKWKDLRGEMWIYLLNKVSGKKNYIIHPDSRPKPLEDIIHPKLWEDEDPDLEGLYTCIDIYRYLMKMKVTKIKDQDSHLVNDQLENAIRYSIRKILSRSLNENLVYEVEDGLYNYLLQISSKYNAKDLLEMIIELLKNFLKRDGKEPVELADIFKKLKNVASIELAVLVKKLEIATTENEKERIHNLILKKYGF